MTIADDGLPPAAPNGGPSRHGDRTRPPDGRAAVVRVWADEFALLGDPSRLALLLVIRVAGPICVSDLAATTRLKPTAVSQALRLLRAHGVVSAVRDGQMMRYSLTAHRANSLLDRIVDQVGAVSG